ncbi:MAG: hypothetical protein ABSA54_24535 [Terriglobales bacterium]|jgi:hypothetical protein
MTFENKIVVGLNDIKAVIFECSNCRARICVSPDKVQIPKECPSCNKGWRSAEKQSFLSDTSQEMNFIDALAKLRVLETKPLPFRILLEFEEEPKAGQPPNSL